MDIVVHRQNPCHLLWVAIGPEISTEVPLSIRDHKRAIETESNRCGSGKASKPIAQATERPNGSICLVVYEFYKIIGWVFQVIPIVLHEAEF